MPATVELHQVTKTYGPHVAVDALDWTIPEGSICGFIGPNGSGKTTTLRLILRILYADRGQIRVFGQDQGTTADDRVGYLPEERGLYKKMKVRDLLRFFARLKGRHDASADIAKWLERFGLSEWADKKVEALSKGMSQKVQFIAAVAARPRLLILDEPFSGLDPVNTRVIEDAVLDLRKEGITVIFSTHDMETAEDLCDTICMIYRGRKVLDGNMEEIGQKYGQKIVRLQTEASPEACQTLPGVASCRSQGVYQELQLADQTDPQALLKMILENHAVRHFEIVRPRLRDIFLRLAGPESHEAEEITHHV